jgi:hypothetical protein
MPQPAILRSLCTGWTDDRHAAVRMIWQRPAWRCAGDQDSLGFAHRPRRLSSRIGDTAAWIAFRFTTLLDPA